MSGTNFPNGVAVRNKYSGNVDTTNDYKLSANTKFIRKQAVIHCVGSDADNAERTTSFTFPAVSIVHDVFLNVITVDATETVSVGTEGTSNDPDGFLAGVSLATAGIVKGSLSDSAITLGALLQEETGTGVDVAYARAPAIIAAADPVSFTCSAGTDTAVFDIIIDYTEVVTEAN